MGRTERVPAGAVPRLHFNSLAPCGANPSSSGTAIGISTFQLTRPVWGEPVRDFAAVVQADISTHSPRVGRTSVNDAKPFGYQISTHSPRVGRTKLLLRKERFVYISTHSPRVGRTSAARGSAGSPANFNSLAPCGANLAIENPDVFAGVISTHSPRVGRTARGGTRYREIINFNSLAPCGANPFIGPLWQISVSISTHSPRVGRTARSSICFKT